MALLNLVMRVLLAFSLPMRGTAPEFPLVSEGPATWHGDEGFAPVPGTLRRAVPGPQSSP